MKRAATIGLCVALFGACEQKDAEESEMADDTAESGTESETGTGSSERCEDQTIESDCSALEQPEGRWCEWVEVWSSPGPCEEGTVEAQCLTFSSPGPGCGGGACAGGSGEVTYVRDLGEAGVQVVQTTCGFVPEPDWQECWWDAELQTASPHPACGCRC